MDMREQLKNYFKKFLPQNFLLDYQITVKNVQCLPFLSAQALFYSN